MAHQIRLESGFQLDFTNLMRDKIGPLGLGLDDLGALPGVAAAGEAMETMRRDGIVRGHSEKVLFTRLAYQTADRPDHLARIAAWGRQVQAGYRNLVSLGIGGSYLGNLVLSEALLSPAWNAMPAAVGRPRIFYSGNNVDPQSIRDLEQILDLEQTMFLVISKSGTTMETMAAFLHFHQLYRQRGLSPEKHFTAVTDPEQGILLRIARGENWPTFEVPPGVGGRWSVLSDVGLLIAAAAGIPIAELLAGARAMDEACQGSDLLFNPAYLYAACCHLLHLRHGLDEVVLMPYSDRLRTFALWYVQLLAESLGKEKNRRGEVVYQGRTPIAAVGTTDMHAQTQQHREGKRNKLVTTIAVEDFGADDITLPATGAWTDELRFIAGQSFSRLLQAARVANEEALASDGRPSCSVAIPRLNPFHLGELFMFFELATAFEGELLDVNAWNTTRNS